jgi:hypothetical protein
MRSGRVLIAAVVFLAVGLWVLFNYCHGTTGFNVGIPVSATSVHIDLTTTGVPALVGVPLAGLGALLLVIAFLGALVGQFRRREPEPEAAPEVPAKRYEPFEE